jgi:hypothetical protein
LEQKNKEKEKEKERLTLGLYCAVLYCISPSNIRTAILAKGWALMYQRCAKILINQ